VTSVGSYEAKTHLPSLLERVARGEKIAITKHGVPVAMLVPVNAPAKPGAHEVIEELKRLRKGRKLRGITIRRLIEEGRRSGLVFRGREQPRSRPHFGSPHLCRGDRP
jgi:prevent-host-death family protein